MLVSTEGKGLGRTRSGGTEAEAQGVWVAVAARLKECGLDIRLCVRDALARNVL